MKKLILFLLLFFSCTNLFAAYSTTFNPHTGRLDFVGASASGDISIVCPAGQTIKSKGTGLWECGAVSKPPKECHWPGASILSSGDAVAPIVSLQTSNDNIFVASFDSIYVKKRYFDCQVPSDFDPTGTVTFKMKVWPSASNSNGFVMGIEERNIGQFGNTNGTYVSVDSATINNTGIAQDLIQTVSMDRTAAQLAWASGDTVRMKLVRRLDLTSDDSTITVYIEDMVVKIPRS